MKHKNQMTYSNEILEGRPLCVMLSFALPIILGNVFQQMYNVVDAIVIGKYLGDIPLAGISIASPFIDILNALIIGATIGFSVYTGQLYGAQKKEKLRDVCSVILISGVFFSILLSAIGFLFSKHILAFGTDPAVFRESISYLYIILVGMISCFFYNYYSALLRSCGNSRIPFIILIVSCCINVVLDILLTRTFHLRIQGVAWATVISQTISAILCSIYVHRKMDFISVPLHKLKWNRSEAVTLFNYSWAGSLQRASVRIGRLLIQGMLTVLGIEIVTGYNMGLRLETFLFCFSQGLSSSMVVCISQNYGKGNQKRVLDFYKNGFLCEIVLSCIVCVLCASFSKELISVFSDNEEVISAGSQYLRIISFMYFFSFCDESIQAYFRGTSRIRLTMFSSLGQILIRVILSYFLISKWGVPGICISIAVGWILMFVLEGGYSLFEIRHGKAA